MSGLRHTLITGRGGEAVIILAGRALGAVGGILTTRVVTELLTPAQIGAVAQMLSVATFFSMLVATPVSYYVLRGFLEWHEAGTLGRNLARFGGYLAAVSLAATALAGGIQGVVPLVTGYSALAVALLSALYLFSYPISQVGTTGFNLLNRRGWFVFFNNVPVWAGLVLAVTLFHRDPSAPSWSLGQFLGFAVAAASLPLLLAQCCEPRAGPPLAAETPGTLRAMARFAGPAALMATLAWIQYQSYRFVLPPVAGAAALGLFVVGYGIAANVVGTFEVVFNQFYEPTFYADLKGADGAGQARAWDRFAAVYLPGLVLVTALTVCGGPFLARLMVAEAYRQTTAELVAWCGLVEALRAASAVGHHLSIARVDMRIFVRAALVGALLRAVGVLALGPIDPLRGTAAGLLIAAAIGFLLVVLLSRAALPVTWPLRRSLFAAAAAVPLAAALLLLRRLQAPPGPLLSLLALGAGAAYVLGVQVKLFSGAGAGPLTPES